MAEQTKTVTVTCHVAECAECDTAKVLTVSAETPPAVYVCGTCGQEITDVAGS